MRYKLTIKNKFVVDGVTHHNLSGHIVVFTNGVAYVADPAIVEFAKKVHFIGSIEEEGNNKEPAVEKVTEEVSTDGVVDEDVITMSGSGTYQPPVVEGGEEEEISNSAKVSEDVVDKVEETEDGVLTQEEIQNLYDELGTWSDVAKYLGVTTTTLRKYREDAGLL